MQNTKTLTASRRSPVIVLTRAAERSRPRPLVYLLQAPALALGLFAAGLALALVWGGYIVAGLAVMPVAGLALLLRGIAQGR